MQHGNKYIVLALLLLNFARDSMPFLLPAVIWDPRNPLFHCPSKANQEINVRIHDSLNLVCPHKSINIGGQKDFVKTEDLYETAYLLQPDQENQYNNCNSSGGRELLKCQTPNAFAYTTLTFKLISGSGDATFVPGKTYYLIGTGNHTVRTIDNKVGGSCRGTDGTYKLKLKIKVCLDQDSSCGICSTTACYTKGCGNYTSWNDTGLYRNLSTIVSDSADGDLNLKPLSQSASENNCVQLRSRSCDNEDDGCIGSSVSLFNTTCPNVKVSPDIKDCSTWQGVGDIYRNSTNGCFLIKSRECWIGTIEKVNTTEWKLEQTICPVGCGSFGNWTKSGQFFWNQTHCLEKEIRQCNSALGSCAESSSRFTLAPNIINCSLPNKDCSSSIHVKPTTIVNICPTLQTQASLQMDIKSCSLIEKQRSTSPAISHSRSALIPTEDIPSITSSVSVVPAKSSMYIQMTISSSLAKGITPSSLAKDITPSSLAKGITSSLLVKGITSSYFSDKDAYSSSVACECINKSKPPTASKRQATAPNEQTRAIFYILPSILGGICIGCAAMTLSRYFKDRKKKIKVWAVNDTKENSEDPAKKADLEVDAYSQEAKVEMFMTPDRSETVFHE